MSKRRGHRGNGRETYGIGAADAEPTEREEDFVVVVDADGNPYDDTVNLAEEEIDIPGVTDRDPIDEPADDDPLTVLQREKADLQRANQQQAAELAQTRQQAENLQKDNHATTKALFTTAIEQGKAGLKGAKAAYAEAMRQQDFEGAADAQEHIARFTQEIATLESAAKELPKDPPARQAPRQAAPPDFDAAVDQYISKQLTPAQQEFAKKHRAKIFTPDSDKNLQKVLALSNVAALEHGVDTPEFFAYIEREMKFSDDQKPAARVAPKPGAKRPPIAAAPVQRGGARQTVQIELSAAERDAAKRLGMSPARYALNKKRALDGAKDPNYTGPRYSRDDPANNGGR